MMSFASSAPFGLRLTLSPPFIYLTISNSYETTQNKKSEPQNIEYRISNDEGWNRFAKSFLNQTEYIHSTFDVGRSMFDVHQFFFDYIGRLVGHPRRCLRTTDIKRSPLIRPNAAPSVHSLGIRIRFRFRWHPPPDIPSNIHRSRCSFRY